ncbi:hypothetical protein, partial [Rothia koreensis]|uniref:hypothetical protein n=1 Tax=Rothia koreensis TaxID=592378 RepID=UPI00197D337E
MHIEGNVSKIITGHITGVDDKRTVRLACEAAGVHRSSWLRYTQAGEEIIPRAPWILTPDERREIRHRIMEIRMPTGFGSSFTKAFSEDQSKHWAIGLKTHDHHKLLQWIYPLVIKGLGSMAVQEAILDFSKLL